MGRKIRINITVDDEIHKTTKDLGFNISKLCENAMKDAIIRMKRSNTSGNPDFSVNAFSKRVIGSPEEIRTPVVGSKAPYASPNKLFGRYTTGLVVYWINGPIFYRFCNK